MHEVTQLLSFDFDVGGECVCGGGGVGGGGGGGVGGIVQFDGGQKSLGQRRRGTLLGQRVGGGSFAASFVYPAV